MGLGLVSVADEDARKPGRVAGELMRPGDGGQPALDGVGLQRLGRLGGIGRDGVGRRRQARPLLGPAECFEGGPVGLVRFEGISGFGAADVGFGLGQPGGEPVRGWQGEPAVRP